MLVNNYCAPAATNSIRSREDNCCPPHFAIDSSSSVANNCRAPVVSNSSKSLGDNCGAPPVALHRSRSAV